MCSTRWWYIHIDIRLVVVNNEIVGDDGVGVVIMIILITILSSIFLGGSTWSLTSAPSGWRSITSDSTGIYLAAAATAGGRIYISTSG